MATVLALAVGVPEAHALLLEITATWTGDDAAHLQEGSIVQVVLWQTGGVLPSNSQADAGENFQAYGSGVYMPDTTQNGNAIIYTGHLHKTNGVATFSQWVEVSQLENNTYDKVYLRVFSATNFEQGVAIDSYWGVSATNALDFDGAGMGFTYFPSFSVSNTNTFEVIPEPGTLGLLAGGGWGLWALGLRGRRRREEKTGQGGERGAEAR